VIARIPHRRFVIDGKPGPLDEIAAWRHRLQQGLSSPS
jgi:hypothetical protein